MTARTGGTAFGLDFGRRRIGVALGERLTGSARPLATLAARDGVPNWRELAALIDEWRPALLVLGLPRHADGSANAVTDAVDAFRRELIRRFALPVATIDERLSSHAAEQRLAESGRRYRRDDIDAAAAALILESYFSEQAAGRG